MIGRALSPIVACGLLLASGQAAVAQGQDARAWLERMSTALATRNYDGKYFHRRNEQTESMRIIHRVDGDSISERLIALDGSGREIIRTEAEVIGYLPDRKLVLVEKRRGDEPLFGTVPAYSESMEQHYEIETGQAAKVLGRRTQIISVKPRDDYRYGYRVWLDHETAMPLKTQVWDRDGRVIEEILFAQLDLPKQIPASALQPETPLEGFRWFRQAVQPVVGTTQGNWRAARLPAGFRLTNQMLQASAGPHATIQHIVFSDGLASVSVFIEPRTRSAEPLQGLSRIGSAFAFSRELRGYQVTAVGEVPARTVEAIAASIEPGTAEAVAQPATASGRPAP